MGEISAERQAKMQAARAEAERLDPVERSRRNPKSKAMAIKAMCWQCMGGGGNPATPWLIGNCEVTGCALYPHRPWQRFQGTQTPVAYQWRDA